MTDARTWLFINKHFSTGKLHVATVRLLAEVQDRVQNIWVVHRPGVFNDVADTLSRPPVPADEIRFSSMVNHAEGDPTPFYLLSGQPDAACCALWKETEWLSKVTGRIFSDTPDVVHPAVDAQLGVAMAAVC